DRRTARRFYLNAGGVQADSLQYDDTQSSQSWDAVWQGATAGAPDGWTAEMAIPLHVLGNFDARSDRWTFLARRYIARTHEKVGSTLIPRAANGFVSYMGPLVGVVDLGPRPALELLPYVAARGLRVGDDLSGSADVGVDAAFFPGHGLLINATVNPN